MENIARAPQYLSDYRLDDGLRSRTNLFINNLMINNWHQRPNNIAAITILIDIILTKVSIIKFML